MYAGSEQRVTPKYQDRPYVGLAGTVREKVTPKNDKVDGKFEIRLLHSKEIGHAV
jgi:hypothetical protein